MTRPGTREAAESRCAEIDAALAADRERRLALIDWADLLVERKTLHEMLHPETRHGGDRKSVDFREENQVVKCTTRFSTICADITGRAENSIEKAIFIATNIPPAVKDRLRGSRFADHGSDLRALALLRDAALQARVLDLALSSGGDGLSLRDAIDRLTDTGRPEYPEDVPWARLTSGWAKAPKRVKVMFIATLVETGEIDELLAQARQVRT